ncbi:UAA transporter [Aspergillus filifer]
MAAAVGSATEESSLKSRFNYLKSHPVSSLLEAEDNTTTVNGQKDPSNVAVYHTPRLTAAAIQTVLFQWTNVLLMVSLIFGGCCANVFALEAIVKDLPRSGPLITFAQFILTALFMSPDFISLSAGSRLFSLKHRSIPLRSWFIYTAFFISVNLLNNWAFAYRISVPLHIILRSGGPVASIAVGYFYAGRRYSRVQILAVALLTFGVVTSALADAQAKGQSIQIGVDDDFSIMGTLVGFTILALAMLLSAFQGIYADRLYETYGRSHWKEALFYSHMLSLPLFFPTFPQLLSQWREMNSSPPLLTHIMAKLSQYEDSFVISRSTTAEASLNAVSSSTSVNMLFQLLVICYGFRPLQSLLANIPVQISYLILNSLTQYWCIRGVHLLSAESSSLTVTIVLNIRKLVSLLLSIHLFGNTLSGGVLLGATLVFAGGAMYGLEVARLRRATKKRL